MKKLLLSIAIVGFALQSFAQTGLQVAVTTSAVSIGQHPLNSYVAKDHQQNINLGTELYYMGSIFGLGVVAQTDFDFDSKALVGVKGYVNLFSFQSISVKAAFAAQTYANDISKNWQYKPEVSLNIPLYGRFDARLAAIETFISHDTHMYSGGSFGLQYRL